MCHLTDGCWLKTFSILDLCLPIREIKPNVTMLTTTKPLKQMTFFICPINGMSFESVLLSRAYQGIKTFSFQKLVSALWAFEMLLLSSKWCRCGQRVTSRTNNTKKTAETGNPFSKLKGEQ